MAVKVASIVENAPVAEVLAVLPSGLKVKQRLLKMRACNEKNEKGQLCCGHLKRWFGCGADVRGQFGDEIYRCERCKTIYLPHPDEPANSGTLRF